MRCRTCKREAVMDEHFRIYCQQCGEISPVDVFFSDYSLQGAALAFAKRAKVDWHKIMYYIFLYLYIQRDDFLEFVQRVKILRYKKLGAGLYKVYFEDCRTKRHSVMSKDKLEKLLDSKRRKALLEGENYLVYLD